MASICQLEFLEPLGYQASHKALAKALGVPGMSEGEPFAVLSVIAGAYEASRIQRVFD